MASELLVSIAGGTCVREIKAGFLMFLVSVAILVQIDPRIWSGLCELIGRLIHNGHI